MSLNWKEINLVLEELDLPGAQIQGIVQSTFDVLALNVHNRGKTKTILIALTPGACRIHESTLAIPKNEKPLRFAEFLKSRIRNGWIEEAAQLGDDRIIRLVIRNGISRLCLYIRLWSNAANVILADAEGNVLDAMRRSPKRKEVTGGFYKPEISAGADAAESDGGPGRSRQSGEGSNPASGSGGETPRRNYEVRELPGAGSFNERLDKWYAEQAGALSLAALREQVRGTFNGRIARLAASLENLRRKEEEYRGASSLKQYGDIIMANLGVIKENDAWLEADNFYTGETVRIKLDPKKKAAALAETYYGQYRKARDGLKDLEAEMLAGKEEMRRLEDSLEKLLLETNPLRLYKHLKSKSFQTAGKRDGKKRPGLSFQRNEWLILVGRNAAENDDLLRKYVKGSDLWLHARDYHGSYVFIKHRAGKTFPLDILLDAGNLALFYSKARNAAEGDLFYTPVKYLRRAKNAPRGTVIPAQEKNLHIKTDEKRLKELELCRLEK